MTSLDDDLITSDVKNDDKSKIQLNKVDVRFKEI